MSSTEGKGNVGVALALVLGAGLSTGIGATVVFVPSLVKLASRRVLASSLGFSAGVMTYVSYVKIFEKSMSEFENAGHDERMAYTYATLCFFGGIAIMLVLNTVVGILLGRHGHTHEDMPHEHKKSSRDSLTKDLVEGVNDGPPCCSSDPVKQLNDFQRMASVLGHELEDAEGEGDNSAKDEEKDEKTTDDAAPVEDVEEKQEPEQDVTAADSDADTFDEVQRLHKMGLNTAIAIGLHNFPEGLATFVATLNDPKVGAVLAVAIAIHNIPEGLCVALPIYYASGNRLKGFMWALFSGASEFIAALIGWAVLSRTEQDGVFSASAYAVLFGLVAGMMIMISIRELLPTAHVYDNRDSVVSYSFIVGMGLMALSLVLMK